MVSLLLFIPITPGIFLRVMTGLFNTNKPSPYDILPTQVLLSGGGGGCTPTSVNTNNNVVHQTSRVMTVPRVLDQRTLLIRYWTTSTNRMEKIVNNDNKRERKRKKKAKRETDIQLDESGHMNTFFIPKSSPTAMSRSGGGGGSSQEKSIFDIIGDSMGIKTDNNGQSITKEVLKRNGITVEVLVGIIGVSITEFYVAGILSTFDDLVYIGFKLD